MRPSFSKCTKPPFTAMIQTRTLEQAIAGITRARADGAEAIGLQICRWEPEYHTEVCYRQALQAAGDLPVYVTNYRYDRNEGRSDENLAEGLVELAHCGAALCDVMGDLYAPCADQLTMDPEAIAGQQRLIARIHEAGAQVLISSHVMNFTPAERVVEMALEQQRRGADVVKIVTGAETMEEQLENLRITQLLKTTLSVPFLFLTGGECKLHRRLGPSLGCCMYLCVLEHDELATPTQPRMDELQTLRPYLL